MIIMTVTEDNNHAPHSEKTKFLQKRGSQINKFSNSFFLKLKNNL